MKTGNRQQGPISNQSSSETELWWPDDWPPVPFVKITIDRDPDPKLANPIFEIDQILCAPCRSDSFTSAIEKAAGRQLIARNKPSLVYVRSKQLR